MVYRIMSFFTQRQIYDTSCQNLHNTGYMGNRMMVKYAKPEGDNMENLFQKKRAR